MIRFIEPVWPAPAGVHALTTLRAGGVSCGPYAGCNVADHVGDESWAVAENRRLLQERVGLPAEPVWLNQVHGNWVVRADRAGAEPCADASFTDRRGVVCAVLTADCLPLLLCRRDGGMIAAVHGGWRGLLGGIVEATVEEMGHGEFIAWLGPAIGPENFSVGDEVRTAFLDKADAFRAAFIPSTDGKWLANLYAVARLILRRCGVDAVFGGGFCTYADRQRFFSYRRDGVTGRMATLIWRD